MNAVVAHQAHLNHAVEVGDLVIESHYTHRNFGVIARPDAPMLRFNKSMPLELVRDSIGKWNAAIQDSFPGHGYYAFSPMDEEANPEHHVLVLFANPDFFDAFMGSVIEIDISAPDAGELLAESQYVVEEISYDDVPLPWE